MSHQFVRSVAREEAAILVLFRAVLRLYREEVPPRKLDALRALAGRVGFDPEVFVVIHDLKEGQRKLREVNTDSLFAGYLGTIERVVDLLDRRVVS